jgi:hypothetical protein
VTWRIEVDAAQRFVTVEVDGDLSSRDFVEATDALEKHPDFSPDFRQLVIFEATGGSGFTSDMIRRHARAPSLFSAAAKRAVVIYTELGFGSARMFELIKNDEAGEFGVFRDLEEALDWLGIDKGEFLESRRRDRLELEETQSANSTDEARLLQSQSSKDTGTS